MDKPNLKVKVIENPKKFYFSSPGLTDLWIYDDYLLFVKGKKKDTATFSEIAEIKIENGIGSIEDRKSVV